MFTFSQVQYRHILTVPDLTIESGIITTLVGSSGSGKTTLLRLLNKLISPTAGTITYQGQDLAELDSVLHRRQVIMLAQNPLSFPGNVRDNLNLGFRLQRRESPEDSVLIDLLPQLKLDKGLDEPVDKLSGGELQRLALGRVLLLDAPVYLLDEPSAALDDETEELIFQVICDYVKKRQKTLVMVTHSGKIARMFSDQIITIKAGQAVDGNRQNGDAT